MSEVTRERMEAIGRFLPVFENPGPEVDTSLLRMDLRLERRQSSTSASS